MHLPLAAGVTLSPILATVAAYLERPETPEALRPALKRAIASNKPALIECPVGEMPNGLLNFWPKIVFDWSRFETSTR